MIPTHKEALARLIGRRYPAQCRHPHKYTKQWVGGISFTCHDCTKEWVVRFKVD